MTNNLIRRIYEHREGLIEGFTAAHGVKIDLIRSMNPDWRDLWDDITR